MYECELCNKSFKLKTNYNNHINRKRACVKEIINCFKCNRLFKTLNDLKKHLNKQKPCDKKELFKCDYCVKQYITKRNYITHLKKHNIELNNNINYNIINNNNNNNNFIINNNNINITINKFGTEDRSFLTTDKILSILNMGFQSMPELIKETHFNKIQPQNHNIYNSNINKKTILIYDGERWIITHKDTILNDLIANNEEFIITNYEELKEKLSIRAVGRLENFIMELGNPEYLSQLKDNLQMILYNYRDIVENTKHRHKKLKIN